MTGAVVRGELIREGSVLKKSIIASGEKTG